MSSLPRFFLGKHEYAKGKYYLSDEQILRHARRVLRVNKGDKVELFDGKGNTYLSEVELMSKEVMIAKVIEHRVEETTNRRHITLAQALPKAGKIDNILRMNTEIGVEKFMLFESDHSIVKVEHYHEAKLQRLKKVVQEASRQSNNNHIPEVAGPVSFDELITSTADYKLILHTDDSTKTGKGLPEVKENLSLEDEVLVCIGPEGGFSDSEITLALENGFQIIKLNLPVLRTETAGLVVCSFLLI